MPIYEYECSNCGLRFEQHQRISDDPVKVCPECAGEVRRVFHPVGVIFKGSGFYVTDNRRISGGSGSSDRKGKTSDSSSANGTGESKQTSSTTSKDEKSHSKT